MTEETQNSITTEKQGKAKLSNGQTAEELTKRLPIPGPGRPKLTEEDKIIKRAVKEWLTDHEEALAESLPDIRPALIEEAKKGNIKAIREIHEVVGAHKNKGGNTIVPIQINIDAARDKYA